MTTTATVLRTTQPRIAVDAEVNYPRDIRNGVRTAGGEAVMEALICLAAAGIGLAIYHNAKRPRHVYSEQDPYDAETEPFDEPSAWERGERP